ncbi:MAG TPA: hypothetical protein VFA43_04730 [Gemmatimonadaceae bacterium]|nr:hypothetical protein [Gemmatimonadaceae bacterium]
MAVLLAAATPFIVLFALSLASAAGSRERSSQWQIALLTGAGVVAAVFLMNALVHFALADAGNNGVGGSGIRAMNTLDNDDWIAFNGALGVMMLAAAGVLLTGIRSTPRWLAWCALPLGVALFIPFADFIALLLTGVWIIVQSLLLSLRRAEAASTVERSQTASAQA